MDSNKSAFGFDSMYDDDNHLVPDLSNHFDNDSKAKRASQDKAENAKFQKSQTKWFAAADEQRNEIKRIQAQIAANESSIKRETTLAGKLTDEKSRAQCAKYVNILIDENKILSAAITALKAPEDYRDLTEIDAYERRYQD